MSEDIINKVALSELVTIDLESFYPKDEIVVFDLQPYLFMGLVLKEKEFRQALQNIDWSQYKNKVAAVTCTADAIIPVWAYMLVASYLQPYATDTIMGNESIAAEYLILKRIESIDVNEYIDKRIVIKGCGHIKIADSAYLAITKRLRPVTRSIMYGEPCSTVPIYKRK